MRCIRAALGVLCVLVLFAPNAAAAKVHPPHHSTVPQCSTVVVPTPVVALDPALLASGDAVTGAQGFLGVDTDGVYGPITAGAVQRLGPLLRIDECLPLGAWPTPFLVALQTLADQAPGLSAQAEARIAAAARFVPVRYVGGPSVTGNGPCDARAPAGFPSSVIQRESGGNPDAVNASSGAAGCAQILPSHFAPGGGCYGMSYDECWAYLWNGGAGASNWSLTIG